MLDQYSVLQEHYFGEELKERNVINKEVFPYLSRFFTNFKNLAQNQAYLQSDLYKLPFNNKMAGFGSGKNGERWTA